MYSRSPVNKYFSLIGWGANFGYIQLLPRNKNLLTLYFHAFSITFVWILRFSRIKSPFWFEFANIPLTLAAARITTSGLLCLNQFSTSDFAGTYEKELEAYVLEDKPKKVKNLIKKYCL